MSHQAPFRWTPVSRDAEPYHFPDEPTAEMRARLDGPAVYRWHIEPAGSQALSWMGKTDCLARTLDEVVHGRTPRGALWRRRLAEARSRGATIRVDVLEVEGLDLGRPEARRRLLARVGARPS